MNTHQNGQAPATLAAGPPATGGHIVPSLDEALAALPQTRSDLTRGEISAYVGRGELARVLFCCADSLDRNRNLVDLLRPGGLQTPATLGALEYGLDTLADRMQDELSRMAALLRGLSLSRLVGPERAAPDGADADGASPDQADAQQADPEEVDPEPASSTPACLRANTSRANTDA